MNCSYQNLYVACEVSTTQHGTWPETHQMTRNAAGISNMPRCPRCCQMHKTECRSEAQCIQFVKIIEIK
jgi:hypothetical protein